MGIRWTLIMGMMLVLSSLLLGGHSAVGGAVRNSINIEARQNEDDMTSHVEENDSTYSDDDSMTSRYSRDDDYKVRIDDVNSKTASMTRMRRLGIFRKAGNSNSDNDDGSDDPEDFYLGIAHVGGKGKGGKSGKSSKLDKKDSKQSKNKKSKKGSKSSSSSSSKSSGKGKSYDNAFDHDDDCECDYRRQRHLLRHGYDQEEHRVLAVGHDLCACPPGKGKGGGGSTGYYPSRPPTRSPTRVPSPPSGGGNSPPSSTPRPPPPPPPSGSGPTGGGGTPTRAPTPSPTDGSDREEPSAPAQPPTNSNLNPTSPERPPTSGSGGDGTNGNNGNGSGDGNQLTPSPPTSGGGGGQPATPPNNGGGGGGDDDDDNVSRCTVSDTGLFGSDLGLAEEFQFQYQTIVIPSVTVAELNIDMLGSVETEMGQDILRRTFSQCSAATTPSTTTSSTEDSTSLAKSLSDTDVFESGSSSTTSSSSSSSQPGSNGHRTQDMSRGNGSTGGGGTTTSSRNNNPSQVMKFGNRLLMQGQRQLQQQDEIIPLDGFSIRPRDTVVEGSECTDVEQVFPCYVVQGIVTFYASTALNDATREQLRTNIRQSVETGNLETADNRFLDVTWRGFNDEVIPDNGGGGNNGGGDNGSGGDSGGTGGGGDGTDDGDSSTDQDPNGVEIDRGDTSSGGLEPWSIALIAVGGVILLCMVYLCFRRPNRDLAKADEDNDGNDSSSSYDEESYEEPKAPDQDHSTAGDGLTQDTSTLGATPVPVYDQPIAEESEGDYSVEVESDGDQNQPPATTEPSSMMSQEQDDGYDAPQKSVPSEDVSDSAYSSYEEVVEDEYEIDYQDDHYEETSLPSFSHRSQEQQGSSRSSFDEMRRKWESSGN